MRIVIPEGAEFVQKPEHLDPLRRLGEVVVVAGAPRDKTDLVARVRDADVVVLDYSMMDAEVLAQCPRLRFVAFLGIGYASCIDVEAATRQGVVVSNTPDYGATSVAEHALGMILALTRHIATSYVSLRECRWEPGRFQGMEFLWGVDLFCFRHGCSRRNIKPDRRPIPRSPGQGSRPPRGTSRSSRRPRSQ